MHPCNLPKLLEIAGNKPSSPSARVTASGLEAFLSETQCLSGAEGIEIAQQAVRRSFNSLHREMHRSLWLIAAISASAPLLGFFATCMGMMNSFPGCGAARATCMAAIFERLEVAFRPALLGLFTALPTAWCYQYLSSKAKDFDMEARNAIIELVNCLVRYLEQRS